MNPEQVDAKEMMKKITIVTKSNNSFVTVMPLDKAHELMKGIEKTPDNSFIDLFAFGKKEKTEGNSEANIRAGEIATIVIESVSNIVVPARKFQIQQLKGQSA